MTPSLRILLLMQLIIRMQKYDDKTIFEKQSGKILGAQLVGYEGVDKRCDVLATAIRAGMTAYDLTELELAYAPPFSSAKDPVNMIGFAIENILTGLVKQHHWYDITKLPKTEALYYLMFVLRKNIRPEPLKAAYIFL